MAGRLGAYIIGAGIRRCQLRIDRPNPRGPVALVIAAVVVVAANGVVLGVDAAVEVAFFPLHPVTSRAHRAATVRRAARRLVTAGMGSLPPAVQPGRGRVPRDVVCARQAGVRPVQGAAAATATSSDDAPCLIGRDSGPPRVAVRHPQARRYTLACCRERGKRELSSGHKRNSDNLTRQELVGFRAAGCSAVKVKRLRTNDLDSHLRQRRPARRYDGCP